MMLKCFKYIFLCILIVSFVSGAVAASDDVEDPGVTNCFDCEHYPTYIKVRSDSFFSDLSGYDGYPLEIYAEVIAYEPHFPGIPVIPGWNLFHNEFNVDAGELFLLRDGEVIDCKDLSKEEPSFLFIFEKDHKYSLKYEGVCISEYYSYPIRFLDDSYKELNIEILPEETLLE